MSDAERATAAGWKLVPEKGGVQLRDPKGLKRGWFATEEEAAKVAVYNMDNP